MRNKAPYFPPPSHDLRHKWVGRKALEEVYGSPLYGIRTGLNAAFAIDTATRNRLCAQGPCGLWLIYIPKTRIGIEDYPAMRSGICESCLRPIRCTACAKLHHHETNGVLLEECRLNGTFPLRRLSPYTKQFVSTIIKADLKPSLFRIGQTQSDKGGNHE
jgi:hypothetical protein